MSRTLSAWVIALIALSAGCTSAPLLEQGVAPKRPDQPAAEERVYRFQDIASGQWGFEVEGASCEDNPHIISFSEDGSKMSLRYSVGLDGDPPTAATYRVIAEGPGFLRMAMDGETRTTEAGVPVPWDLVLLSPDSYCWHRTDWQPGGCTQPATRCGGSVASD